MSAGTKGLGRKNVDESFLATSEEVRERTTGSGNVETIAMRWLLSSGHGEGYSAFPIHVAVALLRGRTTRDRSRQYTASRGSHRGIDSLNRIPPENDMPQELHDSSALRIIQLRMQHPVPEPDIVAFRPSPHLLRGDGELCAAGGAHQSRCRDSGQGRGGGQGHSAGRISN